VTVHEEAGGVLDFLQKHGKAFGFWESTGRSMDFRPEFLKEAGLKLIAERISGERDKPVAIPEKEVPRFCWAGGAAGGVGGGARRLAGLTRFLSYVFAFISIRTRKTPDTFVPGVLISVEL